MNKFDALNIVTVSNLAAPDKAMLVELILRSDDKWYSWPSVQRLCMARGMVHEKNFKGAEFYLPGIVKKQKKGRRMTYTLVPSEIEKLDRASVVIKHTPAEKGACTPGAADNTPSAAENVPAQEGANTTKNTTKNTTEDTSTLGAATAAQTAEVDDTSSNFVEDTVPSNIAVGAVGVDSPHRNAPASAGVSIEKEEPENSHAPGLARFSQREMVEAYTTHMRYSGMTTAQKDAVRTLVLDQEWNIGQISPNHRVSDAIQAALHG